MKAWKSPDDMEIDELPEKVVVQKTRGHYVDVSKVYDYIYRPKAYADQMLYQWLQMSKRMMSMSDEDQDELDLIGSDAELSIMKLKFRKEWKHQRRGKRLLQTKLEGLQPFH